LGAALVVCALLLVVQISPWWYSSIDSASYLLMARSLARSAGLTNLGSRLWRYSPGHPALISPVFLMDDRTVFESELPGDLYRMLDLAHDRRMLRDQETDEAQAHWLVAPRDLDVPAAHMPHQTPTGESVWKSVFASQPGMVRPSEWMCGAMIRSGDQEGETRLMVNGVRNDDGTSIPYHGMNTERGFIGCLRGETGCWNGELAEILVYGDALSEKDHRAVERYLKQKYGLVSK